MKPDKTEVSHFSSVQIRYDSNLSDNNIEAMEYVVEGNPLSFDDYNAMVIEPLIRCLNLQPDDRVLDVGCGAGLILKEVEKHVEHAEGFDISENMVCRFDGKSRVYRSSIDEIDYPEESFDKIYMFSVALHFPSREYFKMAASKLMRLVKPSGTLLIGDLIVRPLKLESIYLGFDYDFLGKFAESTGWAWSISSQEKRKRNLSHRVNLTLQRD